MKRFLLFQIGDVHFGMELPLVRGIHGAGVLLREQVENVSQGKLILENQATRLLDLSMLLNPEKSTGARLESKIVHARTESGSVALMVDRVEQVINAADDKVDPLPPIFSERSCSCFPMVLDNNGVLVPLLNPEGIEIVGREAPAPEYAVSTSEAGDVPYDQDEIIDLTEVVQMPTVPEEEISESGHGIPSMLEAAPIMEDETAFPTMAGEFDTDEEILPLMAEELHIDEQILPTMAEEIRIDEENLSTMAEEIDIDGEISSIPAEPADPIVPETMPEIEHIAPEHGVNIYTDPANLELVLMNMMAQKAMSDRVIQIFTRLTEKTVEKKMQKVKQNLAAVLINNIGI